MKGQKTAAEIAFIYKVHPSQVNQWKKHLKEDVSEISCSGQKKKKGRQSPAGKRTANFLKIEMEGEEKAARHEDTPHTTCRSKARLSPQHSLPQHPLSVVIRWSGTRSCQKQPVTVFLT